jgi:hypothetical protein
LANVPHTIGVDPIAIPLSSLPSLFPGKATSNNNGKNAYLPNIPVALGSYVTHFCEVRYKKEFIRESCFTLFSNKQGCCSKINPYSHLSCLLSWW